MKSESQAVLLAILPKIESLKSDLEAKLEGENRDVLSEVNDLKQMLIEDHKCLLDGMKTDLETVLKKSEATHDQTAGNLITTVFWLILSQYSSCILSCNFGFC